MLRSALPSLAALALLSAPLCRAEDVTRGPLWAADHPVKNAAVSAFLVEAQVEGFPDVLVTSVGRNGPWRSTVLSGRTGEVLWTTEHESRPTVCPVRNEGGGAHLLVAESDMATVLDCAHGSVLLSARLPASAGPATSGDIDGDGRGDVVIAVGEVQNDRLLALSGRGLDLLFDTAAVRDESRLGSGFSNPVAADADGDGRCEVYVIENTDHLTKIEPDGRRAWSIRLDARTGRIPKGAITGLPLLADVTGDGLMELCVGALAGRVSIIDPASGEVIVSRRFGARSESDLRRLRRLPRFMRSLLEDAGEPVNGLTGLELDGRAGLELVFGCGDGRLYAYSPAGDEVLWSCGSEATVYDPPIALMLNSDDVPDLVAWQYYEVMFVDGATGRPLHAVPRWGGVDLRDPSTLLVADLDGDGFLECVFVERRGAKVAAWPTGLPALRRRAAR